MYPSFPPINVCRQFFTDRFGQFHNLSFGIDQRIPQRVETKVTGNGQRHRYLRGSDVSKSVGISIGTFGKITVKRGDDGIFAFGVISIALPLANTRSAAFAIIVAPISSKAAIMPSRSAVARICSEPGLTISGEATFKFFSFTCRAREAARLKS